MIADLLSVIVAGWLTYWAYDYFRYALRVWKESPTLYIPTFYAECALFIGLVLMTFYAAWYLVKKQSPAFSGAEFRERSVTMEIVTISLIALAVLITLLSFGVPLPYCFGGALMTMCLFGGATMQGTMVWGYTQLANPVLLCIPLFVFAGTIMSESGIAASLLRFVNIFVGRVRGGLGVVAAVSCAIIGAISGSGLTGVAATGPLLIPEMAEKGYPRGYATALVANSSILGAAHPAKRHHDHLRLGHRYLDSGLFSGHPGAGAADHLPVLSGQSGDGAEISPGAGSS